MRNRKGLDLAGMRGLKQLGAGSWGGKKSNQKTLNRKKSVFNKRKEEKKNFT